MGFDNLDEDTAAHSCQRQTASWLVPINWSILDVSLWTEIRQE